MPRPEPKCQDLKKVQRTWKIVPFVKYSREKVRPLLPEKLLKIEALRVVVGLNECRIDVCIIAIDFT